MFSHRYCNVGALHVTTCALFHVAELHNYQHVELHFGVHCSWYGLQIFSHRYCSVGALRATTHTLFLVAELESRISACRVASQCASFMVWSSDIFCPCYCSPDITLCG